MKKRNYSDSLKFTRVATVQVFTSAVLRAVRVLSSIALRACQTHAKDSAAPLEQLVLTENDSDYLWCDHDGEDSSCFLFSPAEKRGAVIGLPNLLTILRASGVDSVVDTAQQCAGRAVGGGRVSGPACSHGP